MNRIFIIILIIAICSCKETEQFEKSNFIFLLTDDQRYDAFGEAGNDIIQTPNIDRLSKDGIRFSNAYVTTSICCTSRASIMSGQYARRHGINDFVTSFGEEEWQQTYPMVLKNAGYRIGFIGKFGIGEEKDMPHESFDYWRAFGGQGRYETVDSAGNDIHLTRLMGQMALEFIREPSEKPFCLSISFKAPHCQDGDPRQFIYDSAYKDLYNNILIPEVENGGDIYYEKFPEKFRLKNEARNRWDVRFSTPELYQEMVKGYYLLIYGVDQVLGRVRSELKDLGVDQNTVFIFIGDNGFYLGEHGLAGKWYGHEESIRVPLIIYNPLETPGRKIVDEMVLNIDIAPTIINLAGIKIPERMQGKSLLPVISAPHGDWRNEFFYEHAFIHATWGTKPMIPGVEGVVEKDFKYMKYLHDTNDPIFEELFNVKNDPSEQKNLIEDEAFQEKLLELKQKVEDYKVSLQ
ncbi:sulfatase [Bacteroidota bacterium]